MNVSDKTLGSWTRSKNDEITCAYDNSRNEELFKFMTFTPEYLTRGSCVAGNTQNCSIFANIDVDKESRMGILTNLNEIQRNTTNDKTMGIRTSPDFRTGHLIDPRLIQDMNILESKYQHNTKLDMPSSSLMNEHHIDVDAQKMHPAPDLIHRDAIRVSTRVSRRNAFAEGKSQSCSGAAAR